MGKCQICGRELGISGHYKPGLSYDCLKLGYSRSQEALAAANARAEKAEAERDAAKAALHDWYCVGCKQRYDAPPDEGASRRSCPKCGKWMLFWFEYKQERDQKALAAARRESKLLRDALEKATDGLRYGEAADLSVTTATMRIEAWRGIRDAYHAARAALTASGAGEQGT